MKKTYILLIFCVLILSIFTSCEDKTQRTEFVTITLDSGSSSMNTEKVETVKNKAVILPSGDNLWSTTQYSFSGWAVSKEGNVSYKAGEKYSSSSNVTLYAVWEDNAVVTYNSNGGNGNTITEYYKKGEKITLKNTSFTKDGHTLSGWSTTSNSSISYTIGQEITLNEDLNLYAVWVENKNAVTITFNSGTVTGEEQSMTSTEGQKIILPSGDSFWSSNKYSFIGWSTANNGTVQYKAGEKYSVTAGITLYAVWEDNPTITYKANGGTESDIIEYYKKGSKVIIKDASFKKTGYSFSCWSTTAGGEGGTKYTLGEEIEIKGNLTLYAIWVETKNAVTVTLKSGAVSEEAQTISSVEGQEITLPSGDNLWTTDKYSFSGWATTENGGVVYNSGTEYVVAKGGATFYAVWETNPTISYYPNEGIGSTVTEYYKKGSKVTLKSTSFTKAGHTLSGWSTTNSGNIDYKIGQEITLNENLNLYAVWVENKDAVKITFNPGTGVSGEAKEINLVEGQSTILPFGNNLWTADNYTFKGWAESTGGIVKYNAGASYAATENTTLYAVWEKNKVTVTFISNGGNGSVAPITVNVGETVTVDGTSSSLSRDGYSFLGWGTTPDGKGGNVISCTVTMSVSSDLTFYAIWRENRNIKYYNGTTLVGVEYPTIDSVAIGDGNGLSEEGKALYWTIDSEGKNTSYDVGEEYTGTGSLILYAQWQEDDGSLTYTLDTTTKTYSVKASNTGISGEIEIPKTYKGKKVTAIDELGFAECKNVTKITIPSSVTSIGGGAFYCCESLESINIPDGITELKPYTNNGYSKGFFGNCYKLAEIELPSSVTSIGNYSFVACRSLENVDIKGEVTTIGSCAFDCCVALKSFTIPESVTSIGEYAFYSSGIEGEIVLPKNLVSIGNGAFMDCFNLTKVTIPSSVTSIGNYAFAGCSNLTISISKINLGSWKLILSEGMSQTPSYSVIIENGETAIGTQFQNCATITSIYIPSSVTSIDSSAFSGCTSLKLIYIEKEKDSNLDTTNNKWGAPSTCIVNWKKIFTNVNETIELGSITWKALKVEAEKNRALLISQDILEQRVFDVASENHNASSTYVGSDIQKYLKGDFLTTYGLSTTYMEKVDVTTDKTEISEAGTDYVFILSKTEAEDPNYYFADNNARVANYNGSADRWWLRTGHGSDYVINVDSSGALGYNMTYGETSGGVRPAFWYTWN